MRLGAIDVGTEGDNIKSPVTWVGNKSPILHILYAMFPEKHDRYIEPFGGSCAVLLGKRKKDKFEVYNDYNHNLTNLFRVMIFRPNAFKIELGFCHLNSRDFFEEWKRRINTEDFKNPYFEEELKLTQVLYDIDVAKAVLEIQNRIENDCDLHRAATFLKLIRHSYSSSCKSFASQPFDISKLYDGIEQLAIRMNNAVVENQDFETLIKHYDREDSFFYCDPPYFSSEYVYDCGFTWEDHVRLHDALVNAKGKWLLSYNDCPEIRELYKGYSFYDFKRVHSMVQKYDPGKEFPELLIANYDLSEKARNFSWQIDLFTPIEAIKDIDIIMKESMRYNAKRICKF